MRLHRALIIATLAAPCLHISAQTAPPAAAPAHTSCTVRTAPMTDGEKAAEAGDSSKAIPLLTGEAAKPGPEGDRAHLELVRAMLDANRVADAEQNVTAWTASAPNNSYAITALADLNFRKGDVSAAMNGYIAANKVDNCNPYPYVDIAHVNTMAGMRLSAYKLLETAHRVDPINEDITDYWQSAQPLSQRIAAEQKQLAESKDLSADDRKRLEKLIARQSGSGAAGACRLVTPTETATIPYRAIREEANGPVFWGLDVGFNGIKRRLEIDTGASGLVISKSAASAMHLTPDEHFKSYGIGDDGNVDTYVARVQSITIGGLEFADCDVQVISKYSHLSGDGLIGGDVFRSFLVTLDFPGHVLKLGPLPVDPGAPKQAISLATTDTDETPRNRYIDPSMKDWIKVFRWGHDLIIPVNINDGKDNARMFIIDTGAQSTLIDPATARHYTKVHREESVQFYGISGEAKKVYTTDNINLIFGHFKYPAPRGIFALDLDRQATGGMAISGFIGADILHQFTLQIDYRDYLVNMLFDPSRLQHCPGGRTELADCY